MRGVRTILGALLVGSAGGCAAPNPGEETVGPRPAPEIRPLPLEDLPLGTRVVAQVAGQPILSSEVFPLLFLSAGDATREAVRQVAVDRLVELESRRVGLRLDEARVIAERDKTLEEFETKVRDATGGQEGLDEYVPRVFGMEVMEYRRHVETAGRNSLRLERLILFELSQSRRVQVRLIRVTNEKLATEIHDKVQRGADFASLAKEHSEDASAPQGGLYPPLPESLGIPLLEKVKDLAPGEVGVLGPGEADPRAEFRVVQVVTRLAPRAQSYAQAAADLEEELSGRALSPLELDAWMRMMEERYEVTLLGIGVTNG